MNKGSKMFLTYTFLFAVGIFMFMSARWYSYRKPRVQHEMYGRPIERGDAILNRFKNKPKEGMVYYQTIEVTTTDSAGNFPFLADTKRDTIITVWSRPSRNEYK